MENLQPRWLVSLLENEMPIDEMLMDLRTILEAFDAEPSHMAFAHLQHEMMRIERFCEDMLPEE